jgi:phage shock protein A
MPVEERTRRMMGESLARVHGEEVADAIMAHLPPVTYGELATKQDVREAVAELRAEMHQGFAGIHEQMGQKFADVHGGFTTIHQQIAGIHEQMGQKFTDVHGGFTTIHQQIAGIHEKIAGIHEQIAELHKQIAGVHKNISRATLALLVGLIGSPIVGVIAERLIPR